MKLNATLMIMLACCVSIQAQPLAYWTQGSSMLRLSQKLIHQEQADKVEFRKFGFLTKLSENQKFKVIALHPKIATDNTFLSLYSPIAQLIRIDINEYLEEQILSQYYFWILPGQHEVPLFLYGLKTGDYTISIYQAGQLVTYQSLKVEK